MRNKRYFWGVVGGVLLITVVISSVTFYFMTNVKRSENGGGSSVKVDDDRDKIDKEQDEKVTITDISSIYNFLKLENKKKNMIYSPLSIKYALSMLKEGASGDTKWQLEKVLGNNNLAKYDNITDKLALANALYIKENYFSNIKDSYKNLLMRNYGAEVKADAFLSANNINKWIENKSLGQIKNMLNDGMVKNSNNTMILINVLAMDMKWIQEFDKKKTWGGEFYLDDGSVMSATTMNKVSSDKDVAYYQDNKVTAVVLDLEQCNDEQMEFIAIMPKEKLKDYVKNFEDENLEVIDNNLISASSSKKGIKISIPRFSFDYNWDLKNHLMALGVKDVFDSSADFTNITDTASFYVSDILHKANIDFSEEGVKAAAATEIFLTYGSAGESFDLEIQINKPFMYLVRSKRTKEIWFVGTVYKPNAWEDDYKNYVRQ